MSTIRLLTSELTVAKSTAAGTSKKSTISNLAVVIPMKALIHPYGLAYEVTSGGTSAIGDVLVTEMLFRSVDNKENVYSLFKGATKISLKMVLDLVKPDAAGLPLTERGYDPDMGLELEIICENTNSTDDLVVAIGWKVGNATVLDLITAGVNRGGFMQVPGKIPGAIDDKLSGIDVPGL